MTLKKLLLMSFLPRTSIVISDGVVSNFSIGYDSDDPSFEILEGKADGKIWKQYYKGWTESEVRTSKHFYAKYCNFFVCC